MDIQNPSTPRHNLPPQPTSFIGREQEIAEITSLLDDPVCRLLTLVGAGGIGKTRLAIEIAARKLSDFSNGVFFVPLQPLTSHEHIVSAIAVSVGYQFQSDGREPKQQVLDFLANKQMLLLMDNFEHLLEGVDLLSDILAAAPGLKLVVTSREALNLREEWLRHVQGLHIPSDGQTEFTENYDAVRLFVERARRVGDGFSLADQQPGVVHICQIVQGMPLAIELVASWLKTLSCDEIAAEIQRSLDILTTPLRDMPERHRSMQAVFDWSWGLLTNDARTAFRRLSVFRGGCTREAAQAVTGADLWTLQALVGKSFIRRDPESGRYDIHELMRQYGETRLEQSGEAETTRDAHSTYYLDILHRLEEDLKGHGQLKAMDQIEDDLENTQMAWLWAAKYGLIDRIEQSCFSFFLCYAASGSYVDSAILFAQAADYLRHGSSGADRDRALGSILTATSFFYVWLGQHDEAQRLLDESWPLLRDNGAPRDRAFYALIQARVYLESSKHDDEEARPWLEEALATYRKIGDQWGTGIALQRWYMYFLRVDNLPEARRVLEEARTIQEELGDRVALGDTLLFLGIVAVTSHDYAEAKRLMADALAYYRRARAQRGVYQAIGNLGVCAALQGDFVEARGSYEESLELARESGNLADIADKLGSLGIFAFCEGDFVQARIHHREALNLLRGSVLNNHIANHRSKLASADLARGDYRKAADLCRQVVEYRRTQNKSGDLCLVLIQSGEVALARGQRREARRYFEEGLRLAEESDHRKNVALCQRGLGKLACKEDKYEQARESLQAAWAYFISEEGRKATLGPWFQDFEIVITQIPLADVCTAMDDEQSAVWHLREGISLSAEMPSVPALLSGLASAAALFVAQSKLQRAVTLSAVVYHHPRAYAVDRDRVVDLAERLETELGEEGYQAAWERGRQLDLDTVLQELLEAFRVDDDVEAAFPTHVIAANERLPEPLTERELQILHLIADGLSNREIADHLVVSIHTVKTHAKNLYSKLEVANRTQAARHAQELGLL